jgi:ParB-like nuclease family protein
MTTKSKKSESQDKPHGIELPFGKRLHPLAEKVPERTAIEKMELADDIEKNGLRDPITLDHTGKYVVDGRGRLEACQQVGEKLKPKHWVRLKKNVNVARFIISRLTHRNLSVGQRAMIAADLMPEFEAEAKKRQGGGGNSGTTEKGKARDAAAKAMGVSGSSVQAAKKLKKEDPEKAEAVRKGKAKLHSGKKSGKKSDPKKNLTLAERDADMNRQLAAKGLPLLGDEPDEEADEPVNQERTEAPTQRVRSWLSAAKRLVSETGVLVGLELSDEEQEVVEFAVAEVRGAVAMLVSAPVPVGGEQDDE